MTHATPDINRTLPNLLTVKEIASFWRVDYQVIRSLVYSGQLPAFKVGKQWRVTKVSLNNYLQGSTAMDAEQSN
jgi:excisionase family DNA binding protein